MIFTTNFQILNFFVERTKYYNKKLNIIIYIYMDDIGKYWKFILSFARVGFIVIIVI